MLRWCVHGIKLSAALSSREGRQICSPHHDLHIFMKTAPQWLCRRDLKGPHKRSSITGRTYTKRIKTKRDSKQVFSQFMVQFVKKKSVFESRENIAVSAAILCSAVCVYDVINNASMCCRSVYYVISQTQVCSSFVKSEPTSLRPEEINLEAKSTSVFFFFFLY